MPCKGNRISGTEKGEIAWKSCDRNTPSDVVQFLRQSSFRSQSGYSSKLTMISFREVILLKCVSRIFKASVATAHSPSA
jgi:hypothetical protein